MNLRPLGKTGIQVSEIGFGTWGIGGDSGGAAAYGRTDDAQSIEALEAAFARGVNFYDTSNLYGWGHSEKLLGRVFRDRREQVILATKAGFVDQSGCQDFSADSVLRSLEGSLDRLCTDYVDVLQLHSPARDALSANRDLWRLLETLHREHTIRCYGISAQSPDDALFFIEQYHPWCIQVNFNLTDMRAAHNGLLDRCEKESVGVIIRTPLAFGFLTGCLEPSRDFETGDHRRRFSAEQRSRWADAVGLYEGVFAQCGRATPAQNALRFCLAFQCVSTVIPGMMEVSHVIENLGAVEIERLPSGAIDEIEAIYDRSIWK